jgi:hypothetical protein
MFVAYSPALELSTCGPTFDEAKKNFHEAFTLFIEECVRRNTLDEALSALGWRKVVSARRSSWQPPIVIGQEVLPLQVPLPN